MTAARLSRPAPWSAPAAATGSCCPAPPEGTLLRPPARAVATTRPPLLLPDLDDLAGGHFDPPTVDDRGDAARARLLRDALRLSFRATAGPFRSFAQPRRQPRNYQLVPLMMAAAQDTTRLLIADGVGIGKTVEAGLIAAELLATGDADAARRAVLARSSPRSGRPSCGTKFGIDAELLLPSTANRLQRSVPFGSNVYEHYPYLVDLHRLHQAAHPPRRVRRALPGPGDRRRGPHLRAPAGVGKSSQAHQRYTLLRNLADDPQRHLLLLTATPHNGDDGAWQSLIGLLDDRLGDLPADLSGRDREDDRKLLAQVHDPAPARRHPRVPRRGHPVPRRAKPPRTAYKLTPEYRQLFDDVLAFAREQVADPELNAVRQRVRWWSAIALLRCLASSPAAAEQTLLNRSAVAAPTTASTMPTPAPNPASSTPTWTTPLEGEDAALGADTGDTDTPDTQTRRRLREFAVAAAALQGPDGDAKLKRLIPLLKRPARRRATTRSSSAATSPPPSTSPST